MVYYSNLVSINSIKIIQRPLILRAVSAAQGQEGLPHSPRRPIL